MTGNGIYLEASVVHPIYAEYYSMVEVFNLQYKYSLQQFCPCRPCTLKIKYLLDFMSSQFKTPKLEFANIPNPKSLVIYSMTLDNSNQSDATFNQLMAIEVPNKVHLKNYCHYNWVGEDFKLYIGAVIENASS